MSIQEFTSYPAIPLIKAITTLENGTRPSGGVGLINIGVPSLGGEHISDNGSFNFENAKFIPEDFFHRMSRGIIQRHDVLIVKDGATTGKVAFVRENFPFKNAAINEHVYIIRTDPQILLPEYLFYFLYSNWGQAQIQREFHGGAIGGINQSFADHLEIPLPTLPEQHRIANILQQADKIRQWRREAISKAKALPKAIFYEMFDNPLSNSMNWQKKPFGKVCDTHLGKMLDKKQQTGLHIRPYLRNINVQWDHIDTSELVSMDFDNDNRKKFLLKEGDVLICEGGEVGRAAIWEGQIEECYFQKALHRAVPIKGEAMPEYIVYLLWTMADNNGFQGIASPMTIPHLTGEKLKELLIPVPPFDLQQEFTRKVQAFKKVLADQSQAEEGIYGLFESITAKAFSGELTTHWRDAHKDVLHHAAEERDNLLNLRGKENRLKDLQEGRLTTKETEMVRQTLGNFAVKINQIQATINKIGPEMTQANKAAIESIMQLCQNIIEPFLQNIRLSMQNIPSSKFPVVDHDTVITYIDSLPIPQGNRAVIEILDTTTLRVLKLAGTYPAYFTPADLETGEFGGITTLQAESSLHVLEALGFVRLVKIDGILRYHLIDETADYASKPASLSA